MYNHDKPQNAVVILDFGGQDQNSNGTWGALAVQTPHTFRSNGTIENFSEGFGQGYWEGTGSDTTSTLRLLIGTNNSGPNDGGTAGQKWGATVDVVGNWLANNPSGPLKYASQVSIGGADDMEFAYGTGQHAHDWASAFSNNSSHVYFDYGGCAGCIQEDPSPWTMEQVYYVAWGASAAFPFPEIYNQSGVKARQWQQLAIYGHREHGALMVFEATLTEQEACNQETHTPYACYAGTDQDPDAGWSQMWNCLNTKCDYDDHAAPDYLNQGIQWSSDIKYNPSP